MLNQLPSRVIFGWDRMKNQGGGRDGLGVGVKTEVVNLELGPAAAGVGLIGTAVAIAMAATRPGSAVTVTSP